MANLKADFLIVGAGILGLSVARELVSRGPCRIIIIEKESSIGLHSSGRNSGVLHAGIYYLEDSLKAQFCLKGNLLMQEYCRENKLALKNCGKVIITKDETELTSLDLLYKRATANGAAVEMIDENQLREIEPNAKTHQKALYSVNTAVIDPKQILKCLYEELLHTKQVEFIFNCPFLKYLGKNEILTGKGKVGFEKLINTAGSYADKVAHSFGVAPTLSLLPFKGLYKKLRPEYSHLVNGNIYQVPNLKNPFLGVHFTKNIFGDVYVGPTAIPSFGRENYSGIKGIGLDSVDLMFKNLKLFFTNVQFRNTSLSEPKKYFKKHFFEDAKQLVKVLEPHYLEASPKVGIRPQLINWEKGELVMDFLVHVGENSIHVLNAISPAFTSAFAFSKHVIDQLSPAKAFEKQT